MIACQGKKTTWVSWVSLLAGLMSSSSWWWASIVRLSEDVRFTEWFLFPRVW